MSNSKFTLQDNFRLYHAPPDLADALLTACEDGTGSTVKLSGPAIDARTAAGGDYILVWLHRTGLLCFLHLPERLGVSDEREALEVNAVVHKVCVKRLLPVSNVLCLRLNVLVSCSQVFDSPIPPRSVKAFAGLVCCPQTLEFFFGRKVSDLNNSKRNVEYPYTPGSLLEVSKEIWLHGRVSAQYR